MKLCGIALTVMSSFLIGCFLSRRLEKRSASLDMCITALEYLKTQICVFDVSMKQALKNTEKAYGFYGMFSDTAEHMDDDGLRAAWRKSVNIHGKEAELNARDMELLLTAGDRLGMTSAENQRQNIEAAETVLKEHLSSAREECAEKGKLYRSLGLLWGIFAALIFL